ncbi:hypothetical protein Tco_1139775 [Tanacetum coccineum]
MLLAMKDDARSNLNNKENDFMLNTLYGKETMEELTAAVILMARIQPAGGNAETVPSYDAKAVSEVNASSKLERESWDDKNTIERILKEKDNIQSDFFKIENEKIIIQHETQLAKKAFKEQENRYLEDISDLEEKLSSHDRIVYKMGQSLQIIRMFGKTPNKVYDPFLKARLGYKNPERLKKAIAAQLLGLKDFKIFLELLLLSTGSIKVTTASYYFNAACAQLQLLSDYYCWKDYADREGIKID